MVGMRWLRCTVTDWQLMTSAVPVVTGSDTVTIQSRQPSKTTKTTMALQKQAASLERGCRRTYDELGGAAGEGDAAVAAIGDARRCGPSVHHYRSALFVFLRACIF